jgi:hypothetical protein
MDGSISGRRALLASLAGAVIGAGAAGLLLSVSDAVTARGVGVSFLRCWMATGYAAAVAGAVAVAAAVIALTAYRFAAARLRCGGLAAVEVVVAPIGFVALGLLVHGAYRVFDGVFFGAGVKAIAISSTALFGAVVIAATCRTLTRILAARFGRGPGPFGSLGRISIWIFALLLLWLIGIALLEREVFDALGVPRYWPLAVTLIAGLAGGLLVPSSRWTTLLAVAMVLAFAALSAGHALTARPPALRQRIALETRGASLIFGHLDRLPERRLQRILDGRFPTCYPGREISPPQKAGRAAKGASSIVLITVDAMRYDRTSLSGYARDTTPALAERAGEAAVFTRAITPASSTRQTFGALFSGLHPSIADLPIASNRGWTVSMRDDQPKLAEYMAAAGYRTTAIVSVPWAFRVQDHGLDGFATIDSSPAARFKKRGYAADLQVDGIISLLEAGEGAEPSFIWTHLMEPHQPYGRGPSPRRFGNKPGDKYDAALHFVDRELGRLVSYVTSPERRGDTYLIVTGDHGQAFDEHGTSMHGHFVYQEEVHVPLLVWGPGVRGRRMDGPVSLLDLFPTLLEMAGHPPAGAVCGSSLLPAIRGEEELGAREVYTEILPDAKMSRFTTGYYRGNHKLVLLPKLDKVELYDIIADPAEQKDLSLEKPVLLREMVDSLRAYLQERGMDPSFYGL